jgi:hypothetical protein
MDYHEAGRAYDWLKLNPVMEPSGDYDKDVIMSQDIPAGKMFNPNQTSVKVTVSSGKNVIHFPDFPNTILGEEVMLKLKNLGLKPISTERYNDDVPKGYYISSDRQTGDELKEGDTVRVIISKGSEEPVNTSVPNFIGLSENSARQIAERNRITLNPTSKESSEEDKGKVIFQSRQAFEEVPNGTVVEVHIGTGPVETTVAPEDVEKSSEVSFDISANRKGDYEFKYYIDGELQSNLTKTFNVGVTKNIKWDVKGTGVHKYTISIYNPRTEKGGDYITVEIDFTQEEPKKDIKSVNSNLFTEIDKKSSTASTTSRTN